MSLTIEPSADVMLGRAVGVDDEDGQPVWEAAPGEEILAGLATVGRLGTGHRCETWLCWSTATWSPVVVKAVRPHQVHHPRAVRSLGREVAALRVLEGHPSAPRLLGDRRDAPLPHVVVEYLDGPTLAELVDDSGPLDPVECALLAAAVVATLRTLHAGGIAHLDVKTENVVVLDGAPHLIDFGTARPIGQEQPPGQPVGTPGYSSPEMEQCLPVHPAMDLFGVGAMMAEALTGEEFGAGTVVPDGPLAPLVRRLLDPDPGRRGTCDSVLLELAALAGPDRRPWPEWADALIRPGAASR